MAVLETTEQAAEVTENLVSLSTRASLTGHVVSGKILFPAVGYVEVAFASTGP